MADGTSSLSASLSYGQQVDKDTQATILQTGLKTVSRMPGVTWDVYEPGPEHPGPATRNTEKRSYTVKTGYLAPFGSTGLLYPRMFGYQLLAAGFNVSTVDNTTHYTHTFTISTGDNYPYITALWSLGDWDRVVTGGRLTTLGFSATPQRIEVTDDGIGMVQEAPAGGETITAEVAVPIKPTIGSGSILIDAVELTTDAIRAHEWTITNTLDTEDYQLWVEGRSDIPQNKIGMAGNFGQIDLTQALFQKLVNGGAANTTPNSAAVSAALDILYQSAENITGAAVPYSVEMIMPTAELNIGEFEANGEEIVRFDAEYEMTDISGEPVTFIVVNDVASYAAT